MITIQDYRNFCNSKTQLECDNCPLRGNEELGTYDCCMGFIAEQPEEADLIIEKWLESQKTYVIYRPNLGGEDSICGIAKTAEEAEEMLKGFYTLALSECLAIPVEESGIDWDNWTEEKRNEFIEKEIKTDYAIKEMKVGAIYNA